MITRSSTLSQLQAHVAQAELARGFLAQSAADKCLLLGEEVGELFKAVRKTSGLAIDPQSYVGDVGSELADILNYLLAIANRYDIDLGEAFVSKEALNETRTWTVSPAP
jgi:NTP pyrophosphatase (non-canonical NTP hydrolase)